MVWLAIAFPPRIAFGAQRRAGWSTGVVQVASGLESTDEQWEHARHEFDVSFAVRTASAYNEITEHFHMARGRARRFPFSDPLDKFVDQAHGVLIPADEDGLLWQLGKRYGTGDAQWQRLITRPLAGSIVYRTRSAVTVSIAADVTIDLATGGVEIDPDALAPGDVLSWAGEFVVPCRYGVDQLPASIINKESRIDGELLVTCDSIPVIEDKELGVLAPPAETSS